MSVRKYFEEELDAIKTKLVEMCRLSEKMIEMAIEAIENHDKELGRSISQTDKIVDDYEMNIEKSCMRILLKQQPVAKDFREVSTMLKMITDIERFADQASDIGDIVATMKDDGYVVKLAHITAMGKLAVVMVRASVDSFINDDERLADEVIAMDDDMDGLFVRVKSDLIELIKKNNDNADQAIEFMMIAKYLERIGDHAVNVAEWTKYYETGVHKKF
ncbi:MAG: phosphate signaling complex protein PhoU [Christensenellales bacterium]